KAASEEIVGHVGALQLPGFKSDRYSFWEFAVHPTPGHPLQGLAQLRFACPTKYRWRRFVTWTKETIDVELVDLLAGYGVKFQTSFA
ncbi:hypothetical protein, partial [Burkholderia ubonensis]|uniref:hypothetical protein n=1 Tax=Burkholderia ubonensis TaxID=101571 RepID=UPI0018E06522